MIEYIILYKLNNEIKEKTIIFLNKLDSPKNVEQK